MTVITRTVVLRKLIASEGMVIADIATGEIRGKVINLGEEDSEENYKEIDENTPLPEPTESEVNINEKV